MARKTAKDPDEIVVDDTDKPVQETEDEAEAAAAEAPEDYDPGGDFTSFEDTAPPGDEPGNDALAARDRDTEAEQALIARNQRRYDLRTSGLSSAEVNEIEASEREEG